MTPHDLVFMRQAIDLAINGRGFVEPNPTVGCIITQNNRIIGQGFHPLFGQPHAEARALASCVASPEKSTVYVTLEPCCHTSKKTPPCAPALIDAKVGRVVVGCLDPNPQVNGQGVAQLLKAGIEVDSLEDPACKQLIAPFYAKTRLKRPYVTLKWAQTRDGAVAGRGGERICITNPTSNACTHRLRARSGAILVGVKTVNLDDPQLTVRSVLQTPSSVGERLLRESASAGGGAGGTVKPVRCVLDPFLKIRPDAKVLNDGLGVVLFHLPGQERDFPEGVLRVAIKPDEKNSRHCDLGKVLEWLAGGGNVTHLMVEPGPGLMEAFLKSNRVDRIWRYTGSGDYFGVDVPRAPGVLFGKTGELVMRNAPTPPSPCVQGEEQTGEDLLEEFLNPDSDAFFAMEPSADMLLEMRKV